ncbi:hypothetical protein [Archaeoglobus sp.]
MEGYSTFLILSPFSGWFEWTPAKHFRNDYQFFQKFGEAISNLIKAHIAIQKIGKSHEEIKRLNDIESFYTGVIGEIGRGMKLSYLIDVAIKKFKIPGSPFVTDIDRIVRIDDEIKAIFEIKHTTNGKDVLIRYNHYRTLKEIQNAFDVPVYFVVKHEGWWYLKPLRDVYGFVKNERYWEKRLKLSEMLKMGQARFVEVLADILM